MKKFKRLSETVRKNIKENHDMPTMNYNDHEGRMAKQSLYKLHKYSRDLFEMLDDQIELEAWVQAKIAKAADYIGSVKHYLEYEMEHGTEENPYEEVDYNFDDDMIEDIHHINDLIPVLKQIYKVQEAHKISLKDKIQVIVEPDDAKVVYETYKKLDDVNKDEFSHRLFESKEHFWNMVAFSRSRGE